VRWIKRACVVVASAVFALYVVGLVVPDDEEENASARRERVDAEDDERGRRASSDADDATRGETTTVPTSARVAYVPQAKPRAS